MCYSWRWNLGYWERPNHKPHHAMPSPLRFGNSFHAAQNQRNLPDDRKLHAKAGSGVPVSYIPANTLHKKSAEPLREASPSPKELRHRNRGMEKCGTAIPLSKNHFLFTHTDPSALSSQWKHFSLISPPRPGLLP